MKWYSCPLEYPGQKPQDVNKASAQTLMSSEAKHCTTSKAFISLLDGLPWSGYILSSSS